MNFVVAKMKKRGDLDTMYQTVIIHHVDLRKMRVWTQDEQQKLIVVDLKKVDLVSQMTIDVPGKVIRPH